MPSCRFRVAKPNHNHPCQFSEGIIADAAAFLDLDAPLVVLDPQAGLNNLAIWAAEHAPAWTVVGTEIEREWADAHANTWHADSTDANQLRDAIGLATNGARVDVDAVITSPAYGNRMADQYIPPDSDDSTRMGYAISLGRQCSPGSGASISWGSTGAKYKALHAKLWDAVGEVLAPDGALIVNVKDHMTKLAKTRTREAGTYRLPVTAWHVSHLMEAGHTFRYVDQLDQFGNTLSPNRERCAEQILVFAGATR